MIRKLTRPNIDTPWVGIVTTLDPLHGKHFSENYIVNGKHIFRNEEDDASGLERTITIIWDSKEVWEEFLADPIMQEMRDNIFQKFRDSGIIETIVSLSEI